MSIKTGDGPFAIIPLWIILSASANAVRLYTLMWAKYSDKESNTLWPSHKTMANDLGWSESSIKRTILELKNLGAVTIENRNRSDGSSTSNIYTLITSKTEADMEAKLERRAKSAKTTKLEQEAIFGRIAMIGRTEEEIKKYTSSSLNGGSHMNGGGGFTRERGGVPF